MSGQDTKTKSGLSSMPAAPAILYLIQRLCISLCLQHLLAPCASSLRHPPSVQEFLSGPLRAPDITAPAAAQTPLDQTQRDRCPHVPYLLNSQSKFIFCKKIWGSGAGGRQVHAELLSEPYQRGNQVSPVI